MSDKDKSDNERASDAEMTPEGAAPGSDTDSECSTCDGSRTEVYRLPGADWLSERPCPECNADDTTVIVGRDGTDPDDTDAAAVVLDPVEDLLAVWAKRGGDHSVQNWPELFNVIDALDKDWPKRRRLQAWRAHLIDELLTSYASVSIIDDLDCAPLEALKLCAEDDWKGVLRHFAQADDPDTAWAAMRIGAQMRAVREAFEPVVDWYDGDGERTDLAGMVAEAVADLQQDRAALLGLRGGGAYVDIVFDGPPGPESGRFVETEDRHGSSIKVGEWVDRGDGYHALRIHGPDPIPTIRAPLEPADAMHCLHELADELEAEAVVQQATCTKDHNPPGSMIVAGSLRVAAAQARVAAITMQATPSSPGVATRDLGDLGGPVKALGMVLAGAEKVVPLNSDEFDPRTWALVHHDGRTMAAGYGDEGKMLMQAVLGIAGAMGR